MLFGALLLGCCTYTDNTLPHREMLFSEPHANNEPKKSEQNTLEYTRTQQPKYNRIERAKNASSLYILATGPLNGVAFFLRISSVFVLFSCFFLRSPSIFSFSLFNFSNFTVIYLNDCYCIVYMRAFFGRSLSLFFRTFNSGAGFSSFIFIVVLSISLAHSFS